MIQLLQRIGWSQRYFAQRVGVDEKTVNRWCSGNGNRPAEAYLELVCSMVGV